MSFSMSHRNDLAVRLLAGLEAGVAGGAVMLAWIALTSVLVDHQSPWSVPNLLASLFYGPSAVRNGFHWQTPSGLALHFFTAAVLGVFCALVVRDRRSRLRSGLVGIVAALVWYHVSNTLLWNRVGALSGLYSSKTTLLTGHLLYGAFLSSYPGTLVALRRRFLPETSQPPPPGVQVWVPPEL
jgi:hypothetical protein